MKCFNAISFHLGISSNKILDERQEILIKHYPFALRTSSLYSEKSQKYHDYDRSCATIVLQYWKMKLFKGN